MAKFEKMQLTNAGKAVLAEALATETPLIFEAFELGDGFRPAGQTNETMTAVVSPVMTVPISRRVFKPNGTLILEGVITSEELPTAITVRELAVKARLDGGPLVVYQYDNADNYPDNIPAKGGSQFVQQRFKVTTVISNAENIIVVLEPPELDLGDIKARAKYYVDEYVSAQGQTDFLPVNTRTTGALEVIIEGAIAFDWTAPGTMVRLDAPLPAGRRVQLRETRVELYSE